VSLADVDDLVPEKCEWNNNGRGQGFTYREVFEGPRILNIGESRLQLFQF